MKWIWLLSRASCLAHYVDIGTVCLTTRTPFCSITSVVERNTCIVVQAKGNPVQQYEGSMVWQGLSVSHWMLFVTVTGRICHSRIFRFCFCIV